MQFPELIIRYPITTFGKCLPEAGYKCESTTGPESKIRPWGPFREAYNPCHSETPSEYAHRLSMSHQAFDPEYAKKG